MATGKKDHFLLDLRAGWREGDAKGIELPDGGACLRLQCLPGLAHPLTDATGSFGGLTNPSYLAIDGEGGCHRADGWGHLLGDDGSGFAVGRAGLASAMRAVDGRGGSRPLLERALARFGSVEGMNA